MYDYNVFEDSIIMYDKIRDFFMILIVVCVL